jgi:hypothetical protein
MNSVVGRLPKALSIFGWGHHFQTIQSMPSNMPKMWQLSGSKWLVEARKKQK